MTTRSTAPNTPLVIDLDGTLLNSDLLIESLLTFLRHRPLQFYKIIYWLFQGKNILKANLAHRVHLDIGHLPYNKQVIELIQHHKKQEKKIVLATASYEDYAHQIAHHLNCFDTVIASTKTINLSGKNKANALCQLFGTQGFDYAGNSKDDIIVWQHARHAYVVNPDFGVEKKALKAHINIIETIKTQPAPLKNWTKSLRLHQWSKNLLIFVPLLASHKLHDFSLLTNGILAFLFFGLCASSVYILNDLLDIEDDRHHDSKRHRPFAAGYIPVKYGLIAFPILLFTSLISSYLLLPLSFLASLIFYYLITLLYSIYFKRQMAIDVITLAILYTMRLIAGICVFNVLLTFWMITFSMFIFLSLALVKRYTELKSAREKGKNEKTRGRGYYPSDLEMVSSLGSSSGYLSVMVIAFYIQDPSITMLYKHPKVIWLACPILLFWITRIWILTHRGQMSDDPIVFAIKDKVSLLTGLLFGLIFWLAT